MYISLYIYIYIYIYMNIWGAGPSCPAMPPWSAFLENGPPGSLWRPAAWDPVFFDALFMDMSGDHTEDWL